MKYLFLLALLLPPPFRASAAETVTADLIRLENKLKTEQESRNNGTASFEQFQAFLAKFRAELADTLPHIPPSSENTAAHARILVMLGDGAEAARILNRAIGEQPGDVDLKLSLGQMKLDGRDYAGALDAANEILISDPKNRNALFLKHESLGRIAPSAGGGPATAAPPVTATAVSDSGPHAVFADRTPKRPLAREVPDAPQDSPPNKNSSSPVWPFAAPLGLGLVGYGIYRSQRKETEVSSDFEVDRGGGATWGANEPLAKPTGKTPEQIAENRKRLKVAAASIAVAVIVVYGGALVIPPALGIARRSGPSLMRVAASETGAIEGAASKEAAAMTRLPWGSWDSYAKIAYRGRDYAQIGSRLYTKHAVDRMLPKGLSTQGRSISPSFVEEVITTGQKFPTVVDGVSRVMHRSGNVEIVTESNGLIVVTVKHVGSR